MKSMFKPCLLGAIVRLLLLCACATGCVLGAPLPADLPINKDAGRGGWLVVALRMESGDELPFLVDTGSSDTLLDKSLEPKLGNPIGTTVFQSWGVKRTNSVYAAPKLFLGGVPLSTDGRIVTEELRIIDGEGRRIMGILSYDCLRHYCMQLDFAAGTMRFLDDEQADKQKWGKAFPISALNAQDGRPAVAANLLGAQGPHSLIDSGYPSDGWLMPKYYDQWTNSAVPVKGEARSPMGLFDGVKYPLTSLDRNDVESDGIGIRFLARHRVTLDFPKQMLYLQRQSTGPLTDPRLKTTRMEALDPMIADIIQEDGEAVRKNLAKIEQSRATELEKTVARNLAGTFANKSNPAPVEVPSQITKLPLGDARPDLAEVGWLKPTANCIPLSAEIQSPLLDSGIIYATGLFAHAPSRYVYDLGGNWKSLRGEAGLHTAFQPYAFGIAFIIKADGREVFRSAVIRGSTHALYDLDVTGVKTLELLVEKAQDQNGGNWGLWLDPTLFRESSVNKNGQP